MKKLITLSIALLTLLVVSCDQQNQTASQPADASTTTDGESAALAAGDTVIESEDQKISYLIGLNMGGNLPTDLIDLDPQLVAQGIADVTSGQPLRMEPEDISATMQSFQAKMAEYQQQQQEMMQQQQASQAVTNTEVGEAYIAENATKEGVQTTDSGLQYRVITAGTGPQPTSTDTVTVHYRGTLVDGTEFDSSYQRNTPATFAVNAVIPGWQEALPMMKEGATWEVVVPPDLAYGPGGAGGVIGPNATLVFEIELLKANAGSGDE